MARQAWKSSRTEEAAGAHTRRTVRYQIVRTALHSSGSLEIDSRGLAALISLKVLRNALILIERAHASTFNG